MAETTATAGVLAGVRVAEFSQLIAAPFCGLTLLDLGAEVIKAEPRDGDAMRSFPPYLDDGEGAQFRALNRGKRSVVADLATAGGLRARREARSRSADVVVENLGDCSRGCSASRTRRLRRAAGARVVRDHGLGRGTPPGGRSTRVFRRRWG